MDSTGAGAGRRLAQAVEEFFEDSSVIANFVFRSEQQGHALFLVRKLIEAVQCGLRLRLRKFFQIFLAKSCPLIGTCVVPAAEFVGGSQFAQPFVDSGALFGESARPQSIDWA